jgi:hypothetical protein
MQDMDMHSVGVHDVGMCSMGRNCMVVHSKDMLGVGMQKTQRFYSVKNNYLMPI